MARWTVRATGRKAGAIGVMHNIGTVTVEADDARGARHAAIDAFAALGFEHVLPSVVRCPMCRGVYGRAPGDDGLERCDGCGCH